VNNRYKSYRKNRFKSDNKNSMIQSNCVQK
jgi:hypothetical protein